MSFQVIDPININGTIEVINLKSKRRVFIQYSKPVAMGQIIVLVITQTGGHIYG